MDAVTKVEVGDLFAMPLCHGKWSFGQVVERQDPIYYMVAFDISAAEIPNPASVVAQPILFLGNFFDVLLKQGRWRVIGNIAPPIERIPFPNTKVVIGGHWYVESWDRRRRRRATENETDVLMFRRNMGPIILERAAKWHFGKEAWDDSFASIMFERVVECAQIEIA